MNNLDKQYTDLLQAILDYGVDKKDRTGTGTKSIFGYTIRHNMKDGFPLLTTKKMYMKGVITELLWFLRGDTNIKFLVDNDCHIWNGDAYKKYYNDKDTFGPLTMTQFIEEIKTNDEFANKWGELGPVYGKQWRSWNGNGSPLTKDYEGNVSSYLVKPIDQIANLINDLKTNPDSRRLMVNAWNVGELDSMVLPPCHYGFQVYTRELSDKERIEWMGGKIQEKYPALVEQQIKHCDEHNVPKRAISLMWNQRSVDTFLGLPFNIASYGLLLEIIAKVVNMVPEELIGNLGDTHLYLNHIEQAKEQIGISYTHEERSKLLKDAMGHQIYNKAVNELMPFGGGMSEYYDSYKIPKRTREPFTLPKLDIHPGILDYELDKLEINMFKILEYQSHPTIKAPLSN
jgi:thymidylate synthase